MAQRGHKEPASAVPWPSLVWGAVAGAAEAA